MGSIAMSNSLSDAQIAAYFDMVVNFGHNAAIGLQTVGYGRGWTSLAIDWREDLFADKASGIFASGPIVSLLDAACGSAVWTAVGDADRCVTLNLNVDYLRPSRPRQRVTCWVECYHLTKRIAFARGHAHDGDPERPIASVMGSFVFSRED